MTDEEIKTEAVAFAKANKHEIGKRLTDTTIFLPEKNPVAVFMAGSPGAGKTEASKALIAEIEKRSPKSKVLRIDPDDLRVEFATYNGSNSHLYQYPISILVSKMIDFAHKNKQSFLLDGTLSDLGRARDNIERCLRSGRTVQILYVYQDPVTAWGFVQDREVLEGRSIPVAHFVEQYFAARDVVNALKVRFQADIKVDLLVKPNDDAAQRLYRAGIDLIDNHVNEKYSREELTALLNCPK